MNDPITPFFSIIIPCYNRAKFIPKVIKSIQNQTFQDFEILIIDDGSKDNTEEVVKEFRDARVKYYFKENEERNIARNYGMNVAKGKFICFLDSDDTFLNDHLEKLHFYIRRQEAFKVFHTRYQIVYENSNSTVVGPLYNTATAKEDALCGNIFHLNAVAIARDIARNNEFINSRNAVVGEDHHWFLKLLAQNEFFFINEVTANVSQHDDRSLNNIDPFKLEIGTLEMINDCINNQSIIAAFGKRVNKYYSRRLLLVSTNYIHFDIKRKALQFILAAVVYNYKTVITKPFLAVIKNLIFK